MRTDTAIGAGKQAENKKSYLSDELIETIQRLGSSYSDYMNRAKAVEDELRKQIEKYMSEHGLWENANSILEIYYCLPTEYPRNYLHDAYCELIEKRCETNIDKTGDANFISSAMLETVESMGKTYLKHFNKARMVEKKVRCQVADYMDQHGLWKNPDAILEVIDYLPSSYLRFIMHGFYYRAKENIEKESQEEN